MPVMLLKLKKDVNILSLLGNDVIILLLISSPVSSLPIKWDCFKLTSLC